MVERNGTVPTMISSGTYISKDGPTASTRNSNLYCISIMLHPNRKLGGSAGRGIPWSAHVLVVPRGTEPWMILSICELTVRDSSEL